MLGLELNTMDSRRAAQILRETGKLLTLSGANPFRVRAYERAAAALEGLTEELEDRVENGPPLSDLDGVGKGLAEAIVALVETGELDLHRELLERYPPSVLDLFRCVSSKISLHSSFSTAGECCLDSIPLRLRQLPTLGRC